MDKANDMWKGLTLNSLDTGHCIWPWRTGITPLQCVATAVLISSELG